MLQYVCVCCAWLAFEGSKADFCFYVHLSQEEWRSTPKDLESLRIYVMPGERPLLHSFSAARWVGHSLPPKIYVLALVGGWCERLTMITHSWNIVGSICVLLWCVTYGCYPPLLDDGCVRRLPMVVRMDDGIVTTTAKLIHWGNGAPQSRPRWDDDGGVLIKIN